MSDIEYKKATYYADDDFELIVEMYNGTPFIHLQLYRASKAVIEKVMRVWAEVKALAWWDGHEAIYTYTQDPRMFRIFGATKIPGSFNHKGAVHEVGKWDLK